MNGRSILITGGTGSFGKAYASFLLKKYKKIKRLVILSRDELKQSEMQNVMDLRKYKNLRYFIGDVRDIQRLNRALNKIDIVIHAAALKQVPAAEYNPIEFIKTNVLGAQNLIEACLNNKVKKVIALSTDKACAPINLYGATKLCSDKLFIAANSYSGGSTKFSIVRYGNVLGSRGSILTLIKKKNNFSITHPEMTRFNITLDEGIKLVDWSVNNLSGGEILVPKIASYRLMDLIKAATGKSNFRIIGLRKGEKLHEEMIAPGDSFTTYDIGNNYLILPDNSNKRVNSLKKQFNKVKKVSEGFSYNSKDNKQYLSKEKIKKLINKFI